MNSNVRIRSETRFRFLKALAITAFVLVASMSGANTYSATIINPLPCDSSLAGFFYLSDSLQRPPVLFTNMPYETLIGYIYADSILANRGITSLRNTINTWNYGNDTFNYALKYIYRLTDYDPVHFHWFLNGWTKMTSGAEVKRLLYLRMLKYPDDKYHNVNAKLINSAYILHLAVGETEQVSDTVNDDDITVVCYSNVIETIKGQVLPSMANSVSSSGKSSEDYDLIFQYRLNENPREGIPWNDSTQTYGSSYRYLPPIRSDGTDWIQGGEEYIVFLGLGGSGCEINKYRHYYSICPSEKDLSMGMFPIIDGNVIDEGNTIGLGASVPLAQFKEYLYQRISQIKNFGE